MKRFLSLLICAVMLLTMIPVACLSVGAAEVEGDWTTYRQANDYYAPDPDTGEEPPYRPAPGYHYTDEGFSTIPADYTGTSPFMTVQTKDKHSVKDGLYLQFRVDEFSYTGPDKNADEWIAMSLWDSQKLAPPSTSYGAGWLTLVRGHGNGDMGGIASCFTSKGEEDKPGSWGDLGAESYAPEIDDKGREIYTLEVSWTGSAYEVYVCGSRLQTSAAITDMLESIDESGDFYVGITLQSSAKDGTASITILKYGTSEEDATTPVGTDSKEPEPNLNITAPLMDPATIEQNKPAVFLDATTNVAESLAFSSGEVYAQGDNSFHFVPTASSSTIDWTIKKNISYAVEDFPVFAMMVRNYWYGGTLWYHCGDIVSPTNGYATGISAFGGVYYEGIEFEDYTLILVDLSGACNGRINGFRIHFGGVDMEDPEFDLCYVGCFRSEDEAIAYGAAHLGAKMPGEEEDTEAPVVDTEAPAVDTEAPVVDTEAPIADTEPPVTETDAPVKEGGCGSVIGFSAVGLTLLAGAYFVKKKD